MVASRYVLQMISSIDSIKRHIFHQTFLVFLFTAVVDSVPVQEWEWLCERVHVSSCARVFVHACFGE